MGEEIKSRQSLSVEELQLLRERLHEFQTKSVHNFQQQLKLVVEDLLQELQQQDARAQEFRKFADATQAHSVTNNTWRNRSAPSKASSTSHDISDSPNVTTTTHRGLRKLPEKVFVPRESYLTALLQVDHMRTIYHIFYIISLMFMLNVILYDYFVEGRINLGLGTFKSGLERIHWVAGVWLMQHVFLIALYYAFSGWAIVRHKLRAQRSLQSFWSHSCLILYIGSQLMFGYVACTLCPKFNLPFVSGFVLLMESTRMLMKMHAFVRYNAARVIAGKQKSDESMDQSFIPSLRWYIYFLFAPTLIYRDNYPRTAYIRWGFAITRLLEVVAVAFLYAFIHERHISAHFANYGRDPLTVSQLIVKLFAMVLPCVVIFLCGFYLILHSWLNFTSELLRFGDRMFYKDWWTSHTYDSYYRNWNVVVHDWLYEYVYRDAYTHIFKGSKVGATLLVFLISALVHEQILGFALHMFFPLMFVFFGFIGVSLVFLMRSASKTFGNIFLWFSLIFGNGLLISLYAMEYYARQNCALTYEHWTHFVVPAVWRCYH